MERVSAQITWSVSAQIKWSVFAISPKKYREKIKGLQGHTEEKEKDRSGWGNIFFGVGGEEEVEMDLLSGCEEG